MSFVIVFAQTFETWHGPFTGCHGSSRFVENIRSKLKPTFSSLHEEMNTFQEVIVRILYGSSGTQCERTVHPMFENILIFSIVFIHYDGVHRIRVNESYYSQQWHFYAKGLSIQRPVRLHFKSQMFWTECLDGLTQSWKCREASRVEKRMNDRPKWIVIIQNVPTMFLCNSSRGCDRTS